MAKKTKMNGRKKLLAAFIAVIIIVLLFSVLGIVVLYLGGGTQQQVAYPDVDLSFETTDGETIVIPANELEAGTATVTVGEDGETEVIAEETAPSEEVVPVEETLPENTEE